MKKYFLLFIAVLNVCIVIAQEKNPEFYNRSYVVYEGCDEAEDLERCYEIKFHEFIATHINKKVIRDTIFSKAKKDTVSVYSNILYDERGRVVKKYSSISSPVNLKLDALKPVLDSIPLVKPVLDDYDNGVAYSARNLFGFLLDKVNDTIVPILGYTPSEVPFSIIEKVPVYKGCDEDMSNEDLKDCMNDKVRELISKNFKANLANKLGLSAGVKRIYVIFKVGKKGKVTDINARGPHPALEEEAIRVMKKIPKLKKPGYQRGKPVIVPYSIPIVFRVTE